MNMFSQLTEQDVVKAVLKSPHLMIAIQEAIAECMTEVRVARSCRIKAGLNRAKQRGLLLGRPSVQNLINIPLVIDLRLRGDSIRAIASATGYSHGTIQRLLKRAEDSGLLLMDYAPKKTSKRLRAATIAKRKGSRYVPKLKAGTMPYDLRPFMSK